jgi:hypothetical protein
MRAKPKNNSTTHSVRSAHKETTMNHHVPYIWRKNYRNNGQWPETVPHHKLAIAEM